jgi:thiamine biosynthesis protein ThiI
MQYDSILVRFGELFLKGRNRSRFIGRMYRTAKAKLNLFPEVSLELKYDHILVALNGADAATVMKQLDYVFGIHSYALGTLCESDMESICRTALPVAIEACKDGQSIKFETTRGWKKFPGTAISISQQVARHVEEHAPAGTIHFNVKEPDETIRIMIKQKHTLVVSKIVKASGGMPVGLNGRTLLMLSGGLDSPVAGYLMMKRGLEVEGVHFESPPHTSLRARQKVYDLAEKMARFLPDETFRLHIVPFTQLQQELFTHVPENYGMTIMRRMMYRIADAVAEREKIRLLSNGESLGQVASQTPESMWSINAVSSLPVIRPVACLDKSEVVAIARQIETFDISVRPFEDCCTLFVPRNPATRPKKERCEAYEKAFEWESLIRECVENTEIIEIRAGHPIALDNGTTDEISSLL